jgi:hypothetical protein
MRLATVIGGRSAMALVDRLVPLPGNGFANWPSEVRQKLLEEARANKRWDFIVDGLWSQYDKDKPADISIIRRDASAAGSNAQSSRANELARQAMETIFANQWNSLFEPLLEALIQMGDVGRADAIMNDLHERAKKGQWSESQTQKAVSLAGKCGRQDVAQRWASAYLTETAIQ